MTQTPWFCLWIIESCVVTHQHLTGEFSDIRVSVMEGSPAAACFSVGRRKPITTFQSGVWTVGDRVSDDIRYHEAVQPGMVPCRFLRPRDLLDQPDGAVNS